jgi:hypothetical protein
MEGSAPSQRGGVYTCSKLKLDSLFLRWFSLSESQELVGFYMKVYVDEYGEGESASSTLFPMHDARHVTTPPDRTPLLSKCAGDSALREDKAWDRRAAAVARDSYPFHCYTSGFFGQDALASSTDISEERAFKDA